MGHGANPRALAGGNHNIWHLLGGAGFLDNLDKERLDRSFGTWNIQANIFYIAMAENGLDTRGFVKGTGR